MLAALAKVVQMSRESGENPTSVIEQRLAELRKAFGSENPLSQYPQNCPILLGVPSFAKYVVFLNIVQIAVDPPPSF